MTTLRTPIETAEFRAFVQDILDRWVVPGLVLGVLVDGQTQIVAFGTANLETGQEARPATLFQIGSISKVFTATLVMQLVDQQLVNLDAPIVTYLPHLHLADEQATRTVTLRHLLTHTAGFYGDRFDDYGYGDDALTRSIATFSSLRQYTPPGSLWAYCNTGFQLAGAVVETVLGTSFEKAMQDRILLPLGLEHSFFFAHEIITRPHAVGHNTLPPDLEERPKTPAVAREWGRSRCRSAQGGLTSTVADLLRFAAFHMGDGTSGSHRVLSVDSLRAMQAPQVEAALSPHWGIGWSLDEIDGVAIAGHGGTTNGFQARLTLAPQRGFAFACLTNSNLGAAAIRPIGERLLEQFAGLHTHMPSTTSLPGEQLARYTGRYERPDLSATVTAVAGGLAIQMQGANPITKEHIDLPARHAVPLDGRTFLLLEGESAGSTFDFILNNDGVPRFLRYGGRLSDRVRD